MNKMKGFNFVLFIFILQSFAPILVVSQTYSIPFTSPDDCLKGPNDNQHYYYDISQLSCVACAQTSVLQTISADGLECICKAGAKLVRDYGGGSIECEECPADTFVSDDGWECVACLTGTIVNNQCPPCPADSITVERGLTGLWNPNATIDRGLNGSFPEDTPSRSCEQCALETFPTQGGTRCGRCNQILSVLPTQLDCECPPTQFTGGVCFADPTDIAENVIYVVPFNTPFDSQWLFHNLRAVHGMCADTYSNLTACQALGNMCVMTMYDRSNAGRSTEQDACSLYLELQSSGTISAGRPVEWVDNMPWLYYEQENGEQILTDTGITNSYTFPNDKLEFQVAAYHYNGSYLGTFDVTDGLLQFCKNTKEYLDAAYTFGTEYKQTCDVSIKELFERETIYYDMYLKNGNDEQYAIPVRVLNYREGGSRINDNEARSDWKLTRRFFMADTVSGYIYDVANPTPGVRPERIWYARSITFTVALQTDQSQGLIYPPYVTINYAETSYSESSTVAVSFEVNYVMTVSNYNNDIAIAVGVLSAFAIVYSLFQSWSWSKRSGQLAIDFVTVIKFLLLCAGNLANVFFVVTFGSAMWWWIFFKQQNTVFLLIPSREQESQFIGFLAAAFVLKIFQLFAVIFAQVTVDIFFIDWERPRGKLASTAGDSDQKGVEAAVSIWRTYFAANEWNEIQTTRKINSIFQIFAVVFFLHVVGFENLATADPGNALNLNDGKYHSEPSRILRFAISALCWLVIAVLQWIFYTLIYERFIEDKVRQYVDLCSLSNISVFIMENNLFGYYIHGRSVHGRADVGLREMAEHMKREEDDLCGQRGLLPNTEQQTFQMALPRKLRSKYDQVMLPIANPGQAPGAALNATSMAKGDGGLIPTNLDEETEKKMVAYSIINRFLQAFVDHSLKDIDYFVTDKNLLENIINAEFHDTTVKGQFYNDNGHGFDQVLFFGHETTLTIFAILFFAMVDLIFQNFVLAGVLTFVMEEIVLLVRDNLGRSNLAKKTLVDKRFLI